MTDTHSFDIPRLSVPVRVMFLGFGFVFFPLGVFSLVKVLRAVATVLGGGAQEGSWLLGLMVTVLSIGVGGVALWAFCIPARSVRFCASQRQVTFTRTYPFGISKRAVFDFADMQSPDVVWIKDIDRFNEGYWALRLVFPDGTSFDRPAGDHKTVDQQKTAAEAWRDEIRALIG